MKTYVANVQLNIVADDECEWGVDEFRDNLEAYLTSFVEDHATLDPPEGADVNIECLVVKEISGESVQPDVFAEIINYHKQHQRRSEDNRRRIIGDDY